MKSFRHPHRPKKSLLITGVRPVIQAIHSGKQIDRIYLDKKLEARQSDEVKKLAVQNHIPVNFVPSAKLNSFNVTDHEGCIALLSKVKYYDLQEIVSFVVEKGEPPLLLILDGITDIRNIGGIARTAYCCGVHAIIIPDKGVGALNEDAILTSAGAIEKIPFCRVPSLVKAVDELHLNGISVVASETSGKKNVFDINFKEPCAIIMGGEEKGVHPILLKISDSTFKIPMKGDFESLNVSVATGMILYEAMKQRGKG